MHVPALFIDASSLREQLRFSAATDALQDLLSVTVIAFLSSSSLYIRIGY
mgnify:CR=1 FL=1